MAGPNGLGGSPARGCILLAAAYAYTLAQCIGRQLAPVFLDAYLLFDDIQKKKLALHQVIREFKSSVERLCVSF